MNEGYHYSVSCDACRERRIKCDRQSPACLRCVSNARCCRYHDGIIFRHSQSVVTNSKRRPVRKRWDFRNSHTWISPLLPFKFIDETDLIAQWYHSPASVGPPPPAQVKDDRSGVEYCSPKSAVTNEQTTLRENQLTSSCSRNALQADHTPSSFWNILTSPSRRAGPFGSPLQVAAPTSRAEGSDTGGHASKAALQHTLLDSRLESGDKTYYPPEAAPVALSSVSSPFSIQAVPFEVQSLLSHRPADILVDQTEAFLVKRFNTVVGRWMDISDLRKTWSTMVAHLAVREDLIKQCCMACAAKQLALVTSDHNLRTHWLHRGRQFYSTGITELIKDIAMDGTTLDPTKPFVATVLCSVYEMIDATGSDWQGHLEGISQIGKIKQVNGTCGGFEEAGFWCFARQEVVSCLISHSKPRIDPDGWLPSLSDQPIVGCEDLANRQILTILGKICRYAATYNRRETSLRIFRHMEADDRDLVRRLQTWEANLPPTCWPISEIASADEAFETIQFTLSTVASAWQMFHLSHIILLTTGFRQGKSSGTDIEVSLTHHARRICGIALSRPNGGARVHSVQALYYAGRCLSSTRERRGCVKLLEDIEKDLGWATKYRILDLESLWANDPEDLS